MQGPTTSELQIQIQNRLIEELSDKHRDFQTHMELLEEIVFRCNAQGQIQLLNEAWFRKTGYTVQETLGQKISDFLPKPDEAHALDRQLHDETTLSSTISLATRWGETRTFKLRAQLQGDWYGSLHDITEVQLAMSALEESEERSRKLSLVASRTDNLVVITDAEGRIEWVNRGFEQISGYQLAEVRGCCPGQALQGPLTDNDTIACMSEGLRKGEGFNVEVLNYTKNKQPYWVSVDCSPVLDNQGKLINFIAIEREITDQKSAEAHLRASEKRYRQILNTVNEPIFRCDKELHLLFVNPAWERLTGHDLSGKPDSSLREFIHPNDHNELTTLCRDIYAASEPQSCELRVRDSRASWRRVELRLSLTEAPQEGQAPHLTGTLLDIDERWHATQAILRAKTEAEDLSRARTRFVANMSHEIRTPLNAIIGMTSALENTQLDNEQHICMETIRNGAHSLLTLVSDILDLAKLDSGVVEVDDIEFDWAKLFEDTIDLVATDIQDRGLKLRLDTIGEIPRQLRGDVHRIRQVLLNLLTNASKFTSQGGIHIRLRWRQEQDGEGWLEVSVADTGIGIPRQRLQQLFDAFTQADPSTTRCYGGTGLGLAICQQICELLGGNIRARSREGQGSVFRFSLPLRCAAEQPEPLTGKLLVTNLSDSYLRTSKSLAQMQGLELLTRKTDCCDPAIAWVTDSSEPVWYKLNPNAHIQTPLKLWRQLNETVATASSHKAPTPERDLSILIADDVPANRLVISTILQQLGYKRVTVVENGKLAVDHMQKQPADVVLLDLHMPVMDGLTAASEIRNLDGIAQPTIIAISADVTTETRQAVNAQNFDGWLPKPMTSKSLAETMQKIMPPTAQE